MSGTPEWWRNLGPVIDAGAKDDEGACQLVASLSAELGRFIRRMIADGMISEDRRHDALSDVGHFTATKLLRHALIARGYRTGAD